MDRTITTGSLQRIGGFWLPASDTRWIKPRLKAWRIYGRGDGPKLGDLEEGLGYVERWTIAVDGGANVGAYARALARRFEHVHSFEPTPDTFAALARNVADWGLADRVTVHPCALSNRREKVAMSIAPGRRSPSARVVGAGSIECVRIDDLGLPDLAFLKLDVEGYEQRALEGAAETIQRYRPVVMFEDKDHISERYGMRRGAHEVMRMLGARQLAVVGPKRFDFVYGF